VIPLLGECVGQAGKPFAPLAKRSVLAFDVRGANSVPIRASKDSDCLRIDYVARAVPALLLRRRRSVRLDELSVITSTFQLRSDGVVVGREAVCRYLEVFRSCGDRNFRHEARGALRVPLAKFEGQHKFGVPLDADKGPSIADLMKILIAVEALGFLFENITPYLVTLHIGHRHVADLGFHESLAAFASGNQQLHDGLLVEARDALGAADAVSFHEQFEREERKTIIHSLLVAEEVFVLNAVAERLTALSTTIPL
jgi:hypothetical protein